MTAQPTPFFTPLWNAFWAALRAEFEQRVAAGEDRETVRLDIARKYGAIR